jgi:hypothetical protein
MSRRVQHIQQEPHAAHRSERKELSTLRVVAGKYRCERGTIPLQIQSLPNLRESVTWRRTIEGFIDFIDNSSSSTWDVGRFNAFGEQFRRSSWLGSVCKACILIKLSRSLPTIFLLWSLQILTGDRNFVSGTFRSSRWRQPAHSNFHEWPSSWRVDFQTPSSSCGARRPVTFFWMVLMISEATSHKTSHFRSKLWLLWILQIEPLERVTSIDFAP